MSAKASETRPKRGSSRKPKAATVTPKAGCIVVDRRLVTTPEAEEALKKQERRGYRIVTVDGVCTSDAPVNYEVPILFLAPYASWWTPKFWGMLDAKVKGREKEAVK